MMARVIEATAGVYETREVEFGRVYTWHPGYAVVECDCGEVSTLTGSASVCHRCGTDHAVAIREELAVARPGNQALHPWRYAGDREDTGLPC